MGTIAWRLYTDDLLTAPPRCHFVADLDRVYVAGEDGNLYIARIDDRMLERVWPPEGRREWPMMAGAVTAPFHVDDGGCFISARDRRVYRFPLTGAEKPTWKFTCEGSLADPVQVSENTVFQYARGVGLYALGLSDGAERWRMPEARRLLASLRVDDTPVAYLLDAGNNLLVVDEAMGRVRAVVPLTGCHLFADNTKAPAIYVASRTGHVYCIRQQGAPHLTAEMLKRKP